MLFFLSYGEWFSIIFFGSIGDFIEIGIDILNPVQVNAKGMDLVSLKKQFGKDITFWAGGII